MKHGWLASFLCWFYSTSCFAISYGDFIELVKKNSLSIQSASYSLEAAKDRAQAGKYYFLPTLTVTPSYKYEIQNNTSTDTREFKVQLISRLYSSEVISRIKERRSTIDDAEMLIKIEEEKLKVSVLKNLISIDYYEKLLDFAIQLNKSVNKINHQVKIQYNSGTSSENNLNRTKLLLNKIEAEINGIKKQLTLFESNITSITNLNYPTDGIQFNNNELETIQRFLFDPQKIPNNLEYSSLKLKYDISRYLALQQDPLFNLDFSVDNNWTYNEAIDDYSDEPKFQLSGKINLFNFTKNREKSALLEESKIAKAKMDLKLMEIQNNVKNLLLLQNYSRGEMTNFTNQIIQMENLIKGYEDEYQAGKVGLYEMLNTRFDLFIATKQKTDVEIQFAQNKVDLMQTIGSVL